MPRARTPHTSTHPGARVRLVLRDGTVREGKFKERTAQFVVLDTGRGPARWLARVVTYAGSIEDELNAAVSAQTRLVSWSRALTVAQEGLSSAGSLIPTPPPSCCAGIGRACRHA